MSSQQVNPSQNNAETTNLMQQHIQNQMSGQNPQMQTAQYPMPCYPIANQYSVQMQPIYMQPLQIQQPLSYQPHQNSMSMQPMYPIQTPPPQIQQPQGSQEYLNGLCGCTKECGTCFVAACVPCGLNYYHAIATENATKGDRSFVLAFLLECLCCSFINRLTIRKQYNIEGNCLIDYCLLYYCSFCAKLQDYYEVDERSKKKWGA